MGREVYSCQRLKVWGRESASGRVLPCRAPCGNLWWWKPAELASESKKQSIVAAKSTRPSRVATAGPRRRQVRGSRTPRLPAPSPAKAAADYENLRTRHSDVRNKPACVAPPPPAQLPLFSHDRRRGRGRRSPQPSRRRMRGSRTPARARAHRQLRLTTRACAADRCRETSRTAGRRGRCTSPLPLPQPPTTGPRIRLQRRGPILGR